MVEFDGADAEYDNFLKATGYIHEYTRRLLERSTRRIVRIPENLTTVNQLTHLVKQLMAEQQELALKVEKAHEVQKTFNQMVKDKLDKCKCHMAIEVKPILPKELNLHDLKREDGTDFSMKIPSTSSSNFLAYPDVNNMILEAEAQQRIDLELMKMIESVNSPFHHDVQHHVPENNGGASGSSRFSKPEPPFDTPFFDAQLEASLDKSRKSALKSARKRQSAHESPSGPYQCRDCDKTFRQKHGLSQHLLTHESHGAFECDGCGKRYSRQESVYRHQRSTQCTKYQTLTNVRHDEAAPSMAMEQKAPLQLLQPSRPFLL